MVTIREMIGVGIESVLCNVGERIAEYENQRNQRELGTFTPAEVYTWTDLFVDVVKRAVPDEYLRNKEEREQDRLRREAVGADILR